METKNSARPPGPSRWSSVERWTVERLDRDAGMARIESVPMRLDRITEELLEALSEKGVEVGMDQLSLWDVSRAQIRPMPIERLAGELGVRPDEMETLSENMVFWVFRGNAKEPERVIHATRAARQISKDLYREVARREGRKS